MAETKINASQTTITASDIGAARAATVLPTASVSEEGKIYQFVGTTTASYTNGYFYKCVSDGQNPATYSWEAVEVQASSGGLPDQTSMSGRFLTTDGSSASWSNKPLVNTYTGNYGAIGILGTVGGLGTGNVVIGSGAVANGNFAPVAIGGSASCGSGGHAAIAIGNSTQSFFTAAISIGYAAKANNVCAIQIGGSQNGQTHINNDANTFKVANNNGNFEIMSADGTIPAARHADTTNASQGMVLTLDSNLNAEWATGGSGGGVSDVTVNGTSVVSGGVATITGMVQNKSNNSDSSLVWLGNGTATGGTLTGSFNIVFGYGANIVNNNSNNNIIVGSQASISGYRSTSNVLVGRGTRITNNDCKNCVLIGAWAFASANNCAIINVGGNDTPDYTNSTPNTLKFCNLNGGYEVISADGTIPAARHADTTNAAQGMVLTLDSNLNAVWAAGGSGGGVSDVTVNGTSVVSGGVAAITCATIDDTSTSSQTETWSASKLNTTIGNIESLLAAI